MEFKNLVLEEKTQEKLRNYTQNFKFKEFFYFNKIKNEYLSVFYLVNIQFWKSKTFPFFAFIFPIFFIGILGKMLGYENMFSNVLSISSTSIGLIALPTSILEFKNSILLKRIGVTKVSPTHFIMIVFIFYFMIMFLGTLFTVILSILLFYDHWSGKQLNNILLGREKQTLSINIPSLFKNGINVNTRIFAPPFKTFFQKANWFGVIYGYLLNCILALVLGVVITSFSKSLMALQALAVPIMVISNFLSGQVLPLNLIISNNDLWNISYITPFKFTNSIIIESFNGNPDETSMHDTYLDLSQLSKTLNDESFKSALKQKTGIDNGQFSTLINYLKEGNYDGTSNDTTKYTWVSNGNNGSSTSNQLTKITEPISLYMKNFLISFYKSVQKAPGWSIKGIFNTIANTFGSILGFSSTNNQLLEVEATSPVIESYKVINTKTANPFNVFETYKSLNLTNDKVIDIITKTEKILNNSLIYLWIAALLGIGIQKFKWSNR